MPCALLLLALLVACPSSKDTGTPADTSPLEDADLDGFATPEDCDDGDPAVHPGATESCNGQDDDCDGAVDPPGAVGSVPAWADGDADGWGDDASPVEACAPPPGFTAEAGDCDDSDPSVHPGAPETCDGLDQDCDGLPDDGLPAAWPDLDGDGHGDASADAGCAGAPDDVDCGDADPTVYPDAPESCDGVDDDCDGAVDEGVTDTFWSDEDGDGWGDGTRPTAACDAPAGTAPRSGDCDDADPAVHPDAAEVCDDADTDEDCDGLVDDRDPSVARSTLFEDADGDGWGNDAVTRVGCNPPRGWTPTGGDCDDDDPDVNPGAIEVCASGDEDCDGLEDDLDPSVSDPDPWHPDTDDDDYGDPATTRISCDIPSGYVGDGTDCDDTDPDIHPGATERCEAGLVDEDCDGLVDDEDDYASHTVACFPDLDTDGFGDGTAEFRACVCPAGSLSDASDCDDGDAAVNPAATEVCGNATDDDCDHSPAACGPSGALTLAETTAIIAGETGDRLGSGDDDLLVTDVDGDGQDDLLLGASVAGENGAILLFRGPLTGVLTVAEATTRIDGAAADDYLGGDLQWGPDLDGDALPDLAACASGAGSIGEAYVWSGWSGGAVTVAEADATLTGGAYYFATDLDAGDWDDDGADDLAIVDYLDTEGGVWIWPNPVTGPLSTTTASTHLEGYLQGSVELVPGDWNADGVLDLAVSGSGNYNETAGGYSGEVFVHVGPLSGTIDLDGDAAAIFHSGSKYVYDTGCGLSAADADGDGRTDLAIAGGQNSTSGGGLFFDALDGGDVDEAPLQWTSATSDEDYGCTVALHDDLDGEGSADLVVPFEVDVGSGRETLSALVAYGPLTDGGSLSFALSVTSADDDDDPSAVFSTGGDVDGDGSPELLFAIDYDDTFTTDGGAVYLLPGGGV